MIISEKYIFHYTVKVINKNLLISRRKDNIFRCCLLVKALGIQPRGGGGSGQVGSGLDTGLTPHSYCQTKLFQRHLLFRIVTVEAAYTVAENNHDWSKIYSPDLIL